MEQELARKQLDRQDCVDNAIFHLLHDLSPQGTELKWDIEAIGEVRDAICDVLVHKKRVISEMDFYPYIKHDS